MATGLLLGIDVGTTSAKAVLADAHGQFLATASSSYELKRPAANLAEQVPEDWWRAVCNMTQELLSRHPEAKKNILSIGVSGQGVAAILMGRNGQPLRDAILWLDMRSANHALMLSETIGRELESISGKTPGAYNFEPKLLWLREHEPRSWEKTWRALTTTAYINFRLTGQAVMNYSDAGITLAWDLRQNRWSHEAISLMSLDSEIYCEISPCHQIIGTVSAQASQECGLPQGIPVIAGGEDTSSAGLAIGVVSGHQVQLSMGLSSTINVPFKEPVFDRRLLAFPHVLEGITLLGGSMVAGGLAFDWLESILNDEADSGHDNRAARIEFLTAKAREIAPGAGGLIFLPYLAGELQPVNDSFARGVLLGLTASTTRFEILRAVMEGVAFAIQHNLEVMSEAGANPDRIIAVGGPSRNDLWCQIISDVTGMPLDAMEDRGGAALGDAILAGIGVGLFINPLEMQRAHARIRCSYTPRPPSHDRYQALFEIYKEIYVRLTTLFPKLTEKPSFTRKRPEHVRL
jgi:xylulokinase